MDRYMGKESVQISAASTVLIDSHKHVHDVRTASTAEDSGEPERNAKHFAQTVINNSNMELEATQAAGIVLGIRSSGGSEHIEYISGWDHKRAAIDFARERLDVIPEEHDVVADDVASDGDADLYDFDEGAIARAIEERAVSYTHLTLPTRS